MCNASDEARTRSAAALEVQRARVWDTALERGNSARGPWHVAWTTQGHTIRDATARHTDREHDMTRIEKNSSSFRTQDASTIQGSLAEFMKSAVPSDVSKATQLALGEGKFGDDAVAFRMKSGTASGQAVDMVWDKKTDTMYQLDKGKMTPVSDDVKNAALARLSDKQLKATRNGSLYDSMQKDMIEAKPPVKAATTSTTSNAKKEEPALPKTDEKFNPESIYADSDTTDAKPVDTKPVTTTQKPVTTTEKPVTTTEKPVTTTEKPVTTAEKPVVAQQEKLTDAQFTEKYGKRTMTTEDLRKNGFDARSADVNGDGAISGNEWSNTFKLVDKVDANKDAKSVNPADAKVKAKLDALDATKDGVAPYSKEDLKTVKEFLGDYSVISGPVALSDSECAKKGLPKGSAKMSVRDGGNSDQREVEVYYDAKNDRFYKELSDPTDGRNTPMVRMTDEERKAFEGNDFLQNKEFSVENDPARADYQMLRALGLAGD
jgi:hypothetical protein